MYDGTVSILPLIIQMKFKQYYEKNIKKSPPPPKKNQKNQAMAI